MSDTDRKDREKRDADELPWLTLPGLIGMKLLLRRQRDGVFMVVGTARSSEEIPVGVDIKLEFVLDSRLYNVNPELSPRMISDVDFYDVTGRIPPGLDASKILCSGLDLERNEGDSDETSEPTTQE